MKGRVKWFNDPKKYGFITGEDQQDYFVHFTAIISDGYKTLKRGETVQFDAIEETKGRRRAERVMLLSVRKAREPRAGV